MLRRKSNGGICNPMETRTMSVAQTLTGGFLALQELIIAIQRERGTACWFIGSDDGLSAYSLQVKNSDERIAQVEEHTRKVTGDLPDDPLAQKWVGVVAMLAIVQEKLSVLRA